uniref:Uncharacterized protein n=1 Tax=Amphimedon queenslandica TaxID=400682 RepID=A0A1X7VU55_AMPQE
MASKFRLIVDISSPVGASVNDGIDPSFCSISYLSVNQAVASVHQAGQGVLMAKLDLHLACKRVSVHPDDYLLLGMNGGTSSSVSLPTSILSVTPATAEGEERDVDSDHFYVTEEVEDMKEAKTQK